MKIKFLLTITIISILVCFLAISSQAVTGVQADEFGTVTIVDGLTSVSTDKEALVVLKNTDGTYSTYYTYYIYPTFNWRGGMHAPDFKGLNDALGTSYDNSSIIRIQLLKDCKYIELPSECNTHLKELYIPENINTTTLYRTYFKALEKVHIPSCITTISGNTFDSVTTLKYVTFGKDFSMTELPSTMFAGCSSLEEIRLPNSVTSIGRTFFSGCTSLKRIYLGENLTTSGDAMIVGVTGAKIYASSKWFSTSTPSSGSFAYAGHTPNDITLYYVGTKEEAETLKANATHNGIKNATLVEYDATKSDDYYVNPEATAWTIVYGYSKCLAFYGGHNVTDDLTLNFTDYTSKMQEMSGCSRNCGVSSIVNEYEPIFGGFMYSVKENGTALCTSYSINHHSLAVYKSYNASTNISYGLVASVAPTDNEVLLTLDGGKVVTGKENAILVDIDTKYASFDFILRGFKADGSYDNIAFAINAYVTDGKSIYYIGNSTSNNYFKITMAEIKNS